ncbi:MAG TPA: hypothetical protein DD745_06220, partial [Bacteroidales bacterium]|nr:hypothetical protein [Bacteroidales bacterium]
PEQTGFSLDGWTSPGSQLSFNIDVTEKGFYQIELGYSTRTMNTGAEFMAFTPHDTAKIPIMGEKSSLSEIMQLPEGEQMLTIQLLNPGRKNEAVEKLQSMIIHRIPRDEDKDVITNQGFTIKSTTEKPGKFYLKNDIADFMFAGAGHDELTKINSDNSIQLIPFADNPDQIASITVYKDFRRVTEIKEPPFIYDFICNKGEKFTLNVEFTSKKGVKNSVRAYLQAE